jgi:AraC-like DNA-binding protein
MDAPLGQLSESFPARIPFEDQLRRFVATSQILSSEIDAGVQPAIHVAERLRSVLPVPYTFADFLVLRSLLFEFAVHIVHRTAPGRLVRVVPLALAQPPSENLGHTFVTCVSALVAGAAAPKPQRIQSLRAARAVAIINASCGDPALTARSVAFAVGVSERYLGKLLHAQYGYGFPAARRQARITAACSLLKRSFRRIKEIAVAVGYPSTSQFDRDFRLECGISPEEYRRTDMNAHAQDTGQ